MDRLQLDESFLYFDLDLPQWPTDDREDLSSTDIVRVAFSYANKLSSFRTQLQNRLEISSACRTPLFLLMNRLAERSRWDRTVAVYLTETLKIGTIESADNCGRALILPEKKTSSQIIAGILELSKVDNIFPALSALEDILNKNILDPESCRDICATLIINSKTLSVKGLDLSLEEESWISLIELNLEAVRLMQYAQRYVEGLASLERLIDCIGNLKSLCRHVGSKDMDYEANTKSTERIAPIKIHNRAKPTMRILHHFACTGGTVISKCLASMNRVALISEVNPLNRFGSKFEPTNPLLLLERGYRDLTENEIKSSFIDQIKYVCQICSGDNVDLIIRDHSHSDFCRGPSAGTTKAVYDYLKDFYSINHVLTVRHPLDSFLSLVSKGWHEHFSPSTLEEYSQRYTSFLDAYDNCVIMRYEDFCISPQEFMRQICVYLDVEFDSGFKDKFGGASLSGDSGRTSNLEISLRPRRPVPEGILIETETSPSYQRLLLRLGYC